MTFGICEREELIFFYDCQGSGKLLTFGLYFPFLLQLITGGKKMLVQKHPPDKHVAGKWHDTFHLSLISSHSWQACNPPFIKWVTCLTSNSLHITLEKSFHKTMIKCHQGEGCINERPLTSTVISSAVFCLLISPCSACLFQKQKVGIGSSSGSKSINCWIIPPLTVLFS